MITDGVRLLIQYGLRLGGVVNNIHDITIYISWAVNLDAYHSQLESDSSQGLYTLLHGYKLSSKDSALKSVLLLGVPVNHGHIHENHVSHPGTKVTLVPCMASLVSETQIGRASLVAARF